MSERREQLARISGDLKDYIDEFCAISTSGANDFLSEKCNDAYLMLQAALNDLKDEG